MKADDVIKADDVRRAVGAVRDSDARDSDARRALSRLAFDVLSRQAEGRLLFAGKEYVEARVAEHEVDRAETETELGDPVAILERGPDTPKEHALIAALAVDGLTAALAEAEDEAGRDAVLERFVGHSDWLETSTPYAVYPFADELLDESDRARLWEAVGRLVLRDAKRGRAAGHGAKGRIAARMSALSSSGADAAREAMATIASDAEDPAVAKLAVAWGARAQSSTPGAKLAGRLGRSTRGPVFEVFRLISGIALVSWALRALFLLVGGRREGELEIVNGGLRCRRSVRFLGRTVRESEETFTLSALGSLSREVRYPSLHLLVGLIALSAGVLVGGTCAVDAVRSGETGLLLGAAAILVVGAGLDLALDVLVPGRKGRVRVSVRSLTRRSFALDRVPRDEADEFLEALRSSL